MELLLEADLQLLLLLLELIKILLIVLDDKAFKGTILLLF